MTNTLNNYDESHAAAYQLLNLAADMLEGNYSLMQLVKWKWSRLPEKQQWCFTIEYRGFTFFVVKNDKDMFDDEWYQSAAEEIAAWLLLLKVKSKTKSKKS